MKKIVINVPENMLLRYVVAGDHPFLVELHNDPFVLRNITHPNPITMEQHVSWWKRICEDPNQMRLVFDVGGQQAGFTKFYDIDRVNRNCVLGADLHRDWRGRGIAKYMWELMLRMCFDTMNMHRVSLTFASYNNVAAHVYDKVGFTVEGRLVQSLCRNGAFYDQIIMYMLRDDWKESRS